LKFTGHPIVQLRTTKENLLNAEKTKKFAQNSHKHVDLKIAENYNTGERKMQHQRKQLSSPTKRRRNLEHEKTQLRCLTENKENADIVIKIIHRIVTENKLTAFTEEQGTFDSTAT